MLSLRAPHRRAAVLATFVAASAASTASTACAGARPRPAASPRTAFEVPGHGALEVAVPAGWTATVEPGEPPAPRTIRLAGPGGAFVALLSPFWNPGEPESADARTDTAQLFAEIARRGALAGAVEQQIPLQELVGDGVHGFWFAATDRELAARAPASGEWRHLLQGAAAVGPLVVAFTLLDNAPGPQRDQLLALVGDARHVGSGSAEGAPDQDAADVPDEDEGVDTVPLRVEVRGKPWTVLVDLAGFRMFRQRAADEGVDTIVVGHHPERGIVASVILRAAEGARDAAGCRDADLAKIRAAQPALADLRLSATRGGAARALYTVPELAGKPVSQLHGHAWLWRDDVCANVHVSKAAPERDDAAAIEAILATARYGEDL